MAELAPPRYSILAYLDESRRPFVSLLFILPILITYEIGVRLINLGESIPTVNGADAILKQVFQSLGFYGSALSAIAVLFTLLFLHAHRQLPWRFRIMTLPLMLLESVILALPVFLLQEAVDYALLGIGLSELQAMVPRMIYCLGAGVYEEFLFRLILLSGLLGFARALQRRPVSTQWQWAAVFVSAILFSAFHHLPPHGDPWELRIFAFRAIAGIYFAWVYCARGFGTAVGVHTFYNLLVVLLTGSLTAH